MWKYFHTSSNMYKLSFPSIFRDKNSSMNESWILASIRILDVDRFHLCRDNSSEKKRQAHWRAISELDLKGSLKGNELFIKFQRLPSILMEESRRHRITFKRDAFRLESRQVARFPRTTYPCLSPVRNVTIKALCYYSTIFHDISRHLPHEWFVVCAR